LTGYTFSGWIHDGAVVTGEFSISGHVALVGSWTVNEYAYTVNYYMDSAEGIPFKTEYGTADFGAAIPYGSYAPAGYDATGKISGQTTVTADENGAFELAGLRPDEYALTITLPDGYIFSHELITDGIQLEAAAEQTMSCSWQHLINRSEKAIGAVKPASISGVIWMDENKNGLREDSEWIMEGLTLELLDEASGLKTAKTVSGANGFIFENVRPGSYTVRMVYARPWEKRKPANEAIFEVRVTK
jgi:predicted secreted protein